MSGIAGIVWWNGCQVSPSDFSGMVSLMTHRGPDGLAYSSSGNVGMAQALLALRTNGSDWPGMWNDASIMAVANVRLYDSELLAGKLGICHDRGAARSDLGLLVHAYLRWGDGLFEHLDGDYAFAIWDKRHHRLVLGRDPFGVKPLFFASDSQRLLFASEPKQILCTPGFTVTPNDTLVGEFLFDRFDDSRETYFRDVFRLLPGHVLSAKDSMVRTWLHWTPDLGEKFEFVDDQSYFDRFRELLFQAVDRRLDSAFPIGSHLSGGLDSGSIVLVADQIYRRSTHERVPLETISAGYAQPACNETPQILSVVSATILPNHLFDAENQPLLPDLRETLWQTDQPFADMGQGTFNETHRILSALKARTLLMGFGGDELLTEGYFTHDLVDRRQWLHAWREIVEIDRSGASHWSRWRILFDTLKHLTPQPIRQPIARTLRRSWQPPEYIKQDFYGAFCELPAPPAWHHGPYASKTQRLTRRDLTHPNNIWLAELYDAKASYRGYETRFPFLDRPLAEYVLGIPLEVRIKGPKWKTLVRRGLSDLLPELVALRRLKVDLNDYIIACVVRELPQLLEMLDEDDRWLSEKYIDRTKLRWALASAVPAGAQAIRHVERVWRASCLELWLRGIEDYTVINKRSLGNEYAQS